MPKRVLWTVLGVVALVPAAKARDEQQRLPAPVTLAGVAGVVPSMDAAEMRTRWNLRFPVLETARGSSNVEFGVICAASQQGVATFLYDRLLTLRFYRGARTDMRVGIGSSLVQLRRAYGSRLERFSDPFGRGTAYRVVAATAPPRNAIAFVFWRGRVSEVRFGRNSEMTSNSWGDEVYGLRC